MPLTVGYLILAASGVTLGLMVSHESAVALIPGLLLQGLGLGIVLTVNDPTGLSAVPADKQGEAAGIINTSEQFGGAIGIAILTAVELTYYFDKLYDGFDKAGIKPTADEVEKGTRFIQQAEQIGLDKAAQQAGSDPVISKIVDFSVIYHVQAFELLFFVSAGIALVGAAVMFALVRKGDRVAAGRIFGRRSRWVFANTGATPAITKRPDPGDDVHPDRP
jgi:hypothetical protein